MMSKRPHVAILAYDQLCMFEFGIAVEVFGLNRPEFADIPWYTWEVVGIEPGPYRAMGGQGLVVAPAAAFGKHALGLRLQLGKRGPDAVLSLAGKVTYQPEHDGQQEVAYRLHEYETWPSRPPPARHSKRWARRRSPPPSRAA